MTDWKVGDPFVLREVHGGRSYPGNIKKVGRSLVTIDAPGSGMTGEKFYQETGLWNNRDRSFYWRIMTPQEVVDADRLKEIRAILRKHCVEIEWSSLSLRKLEAILAIVTGDLGEEALT